MPRYETVIDLRTRETVVVDECDGVPIGGGRCIELPAATFHMEEFPEGPLTLRLCPTHAGLFADDQRMRMIDGCEIPYSLEWDR